jgi:methylglutaconyl-CoA hydratase
MRALFSLTRPTGVPSRYLRRAYSSQASSLVKIHDIPAPSSGRIRILSLSRPEARNAISRQLLQELRNAVHDIDSEYERVNPAAKTGLGPSVEAPQQKIFGGAAGVDAKAPTRAVILASEVDSCFCAGADLKERKGMSESEYVL